MLGTHSKLHRDQMPHTYDISPLRVKTFLYLVTISSILHLFSHALRFLGICNINCQYIIGWIVVLEDNQHFASR